MAKLITSKNEPAPKDGLCTRAMSLLRQTQTRAVSIKYVKLHYFNYRLILFVSNSFIFSSRNSGCKTPYIYLIR